NEPFNMNDDQDWALFWLTVRDMLSSDPDGCTDTHWVGTVHERVSGFNGIGGIPGLSLSDLVDDAPPVPLPDGPTSNDLVVRMEPDSAGMNAWDSVMGGRTLAHELGHNYGRKHIDQTMSPAGCGNTQPESPYQAYPFDACSIGAAIGRTALFGFDPISQSVVPPTSGGDLMSYSTTRWISKFTWDAIFSETETFQPIALEEVPLITGPLLFVHGYIAKKEASAEFRHFYSFPEGTANRNKVLRSLKAAQKVPTQSPFRIRLLDQDGNKLSEAPLVLNKSADDKAKRVGFGQFIQLETRTRRIQLLKGEKLLTERVVSANAPKVSLLAPIVNETAETIHFAWTASDSDNDPLLFTVQYSWDDGLSWRAVRIDYPWLGITLNTRTLPGSSVARLRLIASDGINSTMITTDRFSVAKHAPIPQISGVIEEQRLEFGTMAELHGVALDAEDGSIPSSELTWSLSGPTSISVRGTSLSLQDLAPGKYTATLTATDSDKQLGTAMRKFEILPLEIPEASRPKLDGLCNDRGYINAVFVQIPLTSGQFIPVRLLHSAGSLFVGFCDVKYGASRETRSLVGLRISINASRATRPQATEVGFYVDDDGTPYQLIGNGNDMPPSLSPKLGFNAVIERGSKSWSAEFRIEDDLIGGWNHSVGLMLSHTGLMSSNDVHDWPHNAVGHQPLSWANAYLGTPPKPENREPTARVNRNRHVNVAAPTTIYLDGSDSFDPDADKLSYVWTQLMGPQVTLNNATSAIPSFNATSVNDPTPLRFGLTVSDGHHSSKTVETEITLIPTPRIAPVLKPKE
ncbi:MAG TPA: hypothetical protein VJ692_00885, partial [Nitrospiraceae bacterium]|nr:hypothetical protein [Nitrospiraceae bacterium]